MISKHKIGINPKPPKREFLITALIKGAGYSAIIFVGMIFLFLLVESIPALREIELSNLLS
jgi:ABC-type phosphate transport system permease subunit